MLEVAVLPLPTWQNFYVIIGTAAATLTGLMFVVMTLTARVRDRKSNEAQGAFSSPTVVHFSTVLFVAAILLMVNPVPALFVIAAATLLLLFSGIHNAWDTVTYVAIYLSQPENTNKD